MNPVIQCVAIAISVAFNVLLVNMLRRHKLDLKYTLIWMLAGLIILLISIFPQILYWLANLISVAAPINALFFFAIIFLLTALLIMTTVISAQNAKLTALAQKLAILEHELKKNIKEQRNDKQQ